MLKFQFVVSLQFGKHTITQASVYHYAFPCVTADTDLWTWGLVSGCKQVDLVGSRKHAEMIFTARPAVICH